MTRSLPTCPPGLRIVLLLVCFGLSLLSSAPAQNLILPAKPAPPPPVKRIAQGYFYIENYQARFECLIDLRTALEWLAISGLDADILPASTADDIILKAAALASTWCAVYMDQSPQQSMLTLTQIVQGEPGRTLPLSPGANININTSMLGFMWEVPVGPNPQNLQVLWKGFIDHVNALPVSVAFGRELEPHTLTPSSPALKWVNDKRLPPPPPLAQVPRLAMAETLPVRLGAMLWFGAGLALYLYMRKGRRGRRHRMPGGTLPFLAFWLLGTLVAYPFVIIQIPVSDGSAEAVSKPAHAEEILSPLLRNIYRAFDHRQESTIYDLIEQSVDGPLLKTLYLDILSALSLDESEAARVHVSEFAIEVLEVDPPTDNGSFTAKTSWTTLGSVGHWGHSHTRTSVNLGRVTVSPVADSWKITAIEILDQRRL